jgi:hypothetical protein
MHFPKAVRIKPIVRLGAEALKGKLIVRDVNSAIQMHFAAEGTIVPGNMLS